MSILRKSTGDGSRAVVVGRRAFDQFDALVEASRGFETDFRQLGPADGDFWLEQCAAPHLLFTRVHLSSRFHQIGAAPAGYRTFALLAGNHGGFRWCGVNVNPHALFVMPSSGEFESVSKPGLDLLNLSLSNTLLERVANIDFGSTLDALLGGGRLLCPLGGARLLELRRRLLLLSAAVQRDASFQPGASVVAGLARLALGCMAGESLVSPGPPRNKRLATLAEALALIDAVGPGGVAVNELATRCGVSRRTLEHAFGDGLGVSPASYLKARRLHQLRRRLQRAVRGEATVAELAGACGFSHLGQLAADYCAVFGELPSVTLAAGVPPATGS